MKLNKPGNLPVAYTLARVTAITAKGETPHGTHDTRKRRFIYAVLFTPFARVVCGVSPFAVMA